MNSLGSTRSRNSIVNRAPFTTSPVHAIRFDDLHFLPVVLADAIEELEVRADVPTAPDRDRSIVMEVLFHQDIVIFILEHEIKGPVVDGTIDLVQLGDEIGEGFGSLRPELHGEIRILELIEIAGYGRLIPRGEGLIKIQGKAHRTRVGPGVDLLEHPLRQVDPVLQVTIPRDIIDILLDFHFFLDVVHDPKPRIMRVHVEEILGVIRDDLQVVKKKSPLLTLSA